MIKQDIITVKRKSPGGPAAWHFISDFFHAQSAVPGAILDGTALQATFVVYGAQLASKGGRRIGRKKSMY